MHRAPPVTRRQRRVKISFRGLTLVPMHEPNSACNASDEGSVPPLLRKPRDLRMLSVLLPVLLAYRTSVSYHPAVFGLSSALGKH